MIFDRGWAIEGGRLEVVNDPVIPGPAVLRAERDGGASRAELRLPPPQSHPGGIPGVSRYVTRYYLPRAPENRVCIAQWHDSWDIPPAFKKHCDPAKYQRWYGRGLFAKVHPPVAIVVRGELLTLELGTISGVPLLTEDPAACGTRYLSLNRPENTRLDVRELGPAPIRVWFELKTEIHDLTDAQWAILEPLLPKAKPGGRPRTTNVREVVNAILYLPRTDCGWRHLPHDFPPHPTVHDYYRNWRLDGTWERVNARL